MTDDVQRVPRRRPALLRPQRRSLILLAIATPLVAGTAWLVGLDLAHAVALAAAVAAASVARIGSPPGATTPPPDPPQRTPAGARHDVARLSWSLRPQRGTIQDEALRRVQRVARRRLAGHGLELTDPRDAPVIRHLLGPSVYRTLGPRGTGESRPGLRLTRLRTLRQAQSEPTLASLTACLDALERLEYAASTDRR